MKLTVELYGRLREAGLGEAVELEVGEDARVSEILGALAARLGKAGGLAHGAALATRREVLSPSSPAPRGERLAALPPVCGG